MQQGSDGEHREVHYSGRVQGVGFRWTVQNLAAGFAVTGYVRNLADGRVELVAEGPSSEIDGLLDAVQRQMGRHIRDVHQDTRPVTGKFDGFGIRY